MKTNTLLSRVARGLMATVLGFAALSQSAFAQAAYPSEPIHLIVGRGPGAIVDFSARELAKYMSEDLGVPIVVENRPGANAQIANEYVARAEPNGYTLVYFDSSLVTAAPMGQQANIDNMTDLVPVSIAASGAFFLYGNPGSPANTIEELVDDMKANPDKYTFASSGVGALNHIGFEMFLQQVGITARHVPYKDTGSAKIDIMADRVNLSMSSAPAILSQYKEGQVKIYAYGGAKPSAVLPEIPTFSDTVAPDFTVGNWFGIAAPVGTDEATVQRLNEAVLKAVSNPAFIEAMETQGAEPIGLNIKDTQAFLEKEAARWTTVIQNAGISN